jgi:hypothetical protein
VEVLVVFSWGHDTPERHKKSSKICIINFSGYAFPKTMISHGIRMPMSGDLNLQYQKGTTISWMTSYLLARSGVFIDSTSRLLWTSDFCYLMEKDVIFSEESLRMNEKVS